MKNKSRCLACPKLPLSDGGIQLHRALVVVGIHFLLPTSVVCCVTSTPFGLFVMPLYSRALHGANYYPCPFCQNKAIFLNMFRIAKILGLGLLHRNICDIWFGLIFANVANLFLLDS